ncbi:DNA repair protein RecO [Thiohalobacter sp. IOR34]|uniref:DNA repair protein RecO n=1 Tax=Thiohalobacter sp. IOR34 TaxID=3057176 RepID=UPI0025AEEEA2|nr:DNA repair protein RecO [Thiohalobacter sp. IOR34]WJW76143.1 DNA repair protein RecO [Thiohalobacter sp. IOR34]
MSAPRRVELQPGFLLHARAYRDSSLLLEVFSREQGRLGLVARGGRGPRSRLRALLQPFRPLLLSWSQRGELGSLHGAEAGGAPCALQGQALFAGFYLNELLLRLLQRQDPHPEVYALYETALAGLQEGALEAALRGFEKRLLEALGYGLLLDREAEHGQPLQAAGCYRYELERGPVEVPPGSSGGLVFSGASLLALHEGRLEEAAVLADAKRLMRAALALYLGGRPLKTREVLQAMGRQ